MNLLFKYRCRTIVLVSFDLFNSLWFVLNNYWLSLTGGRPLSVFNIIVVTGLVRLSCLYSWTYGCCNINKDVYLKCCMLIMSCEHMQIECPCFLDEIKPWHEISDRNKLVEFNADGNFQDHQHFCTYKKNISSLFSTVHRMSP